jgi:cobalt-zinc-cadmium efflux system outer membrane protein
MAAQKLLVSLAYVCAASAQCVYAQTGQGSLTVDQAVHEALDHNLALVAERYNVQVADAAILTASLRPNPVLTVSATQPQSLLESAGVAVQEDVVHRDYLIERGGKRQLRADEARAVRSVTELQLLDTMRQLRLDVESACVDVQLAQLSVALVRDNLKAFGDVVEVNSERVRAGDLSQVELSRSRLAAVQFENDVRQEEGRLRTARNRLGLLLGRSGDTRALGVTGDLRSDALGLDLDGLRAQALAARPDLLAAEREQARTAADARLQAANGKVDVTVSGEYHRQRGGGLEGNTAGAFVSVPLPVFSRNQGEIARARAQQLQADARTHALTAAISTEIANAYGEYDTARTVLATIEGQMLQQARDVRSATEYSYRRGEASFVEFLDAVRAFNDTMQSCNEARADYARSLFTLDSLAGKVTP